MTLELQETRGAEQAIRLFGLLIKNQKDVVESLTTGNKDFLYEVFNKALFDLQLMHIKFQAYKPSADRVIKDLNLYARFKDLVLHPDAWLAGEDGAILNNDLGIIEGEKNSNQQALPLPVVETSQAASVAAPDPTKPDILAALQTYFTEIKKFTSSIRVDFDPLVPTDYSFYLTPLREGMSTLGLWILPSLYGMLGAVIFHMRRLLEPNVPNPSWLRFAYRIVLGGFAGIILVWFWNPSPQKLTQPAFSTLTSFGLAFVVGFSTDVFFQALDRLVHYLSQAVGKEGT